MIKNIGKKMLYTALEKNAESNSKNIAQELNRRALATTVDYIENKMFNVPTFKDKFELHDFALSQVQLPDGLFRDSPIVCVNGFA